MDAEALSEQGEIADGGAKPGFGRYGYLVRDGYCSRGKGDWKRKDFEVGVSVCGKKIRFCWNSDEEDGLERRRQIYLSAEDVRSILDGEAK